MNNAANIVSTLLEDDFDPKEAALDLSRRRISKQELNALLAKSPCGLVVRQIDDPPSHWAYYTVHGTATYGNPQTIEHDITHLLHRERIPYEGLDASSYESSFRWCFSVPTEKIVIRENEEVDPKEFALSNIDKKTVYHNIVFMQGDDAQEPLQILDEQGEEKALEYLAQWDYGGENEHSPTTTQTWSDGDRTYTQELENGEFYVLSYSPRYGYIGLTRAKKYLYGLPH